MKKHLKKFSKTKSKQSDSSSKDLVTTSNLPKVTNETVAEHREEVLSSARKYIYPLQHSKHRIVVLTVSIVLATLVFFFSYCTIALYRLQSTSAFLYKATQVIPFPVARQGSRFIAYENYLFEVRRYKHFQENQQDIDFETEFGRSQLDEYKRRAMDKVINDAYIKQLAKENGISVSDQEVEDQITLLRNQDKLGSSEDVLEDVLREYFGWSRNDFKRYTRSNLLEQKVLAALDVDASGRAEAVMASLANGMDFATVAAQFSDNAATKANGGEYGFLIDKTNTDLPPQAIDAIFKLEPGQTSGIVNTGNALEVFKLIELTDGKAKAAHVSINFKDINEIINNEKAKKPTRTYITLEEPEPVTPVQ